MDPIRTLIIELLGLKEKDIPDGTGVEGFTDEQLAAAKAKAEEVRPSLREARDLDSFTKNVDAVVEIDKEITARADAQVKLDAEFDKTAARIEVSDPEPKPEPEPEPTPTPDPTPVPDPEPTPEPAPEVKTPEPVMAAAPPAPDPSRAPDPTVKVSLTASGDVKGFSAGQDMSPSQLAGAFTDKAKAVMSGKKEGKWSVATLDWSDQYTNEPLSPSRTAEQNAAIAAPLVAAAQERTADVLEQIRASGGDMGKLMTLTAEGGLCFPLPVRYDVFTQGSTARPLRDSLLRLGAERGGIRTLRGPTLPGGELDGSVASYTEAQDAGGYDYPKDCLRVECGEDLSVTVDAVTKCLIAGNYLRLYNNEQFQAWWKIAGVLHARTAETKAWNELVGHSTAVIVTVNYGALGAAREILRGVAVAAEQYRDRHRIDSDTPLRLRAPRWMTLMMQLDLSAQSPGDGTVSVAQATIVQYLANFNVAVTFVMDGQAAADSGYAQAAGALNALPDTMDAILSLEGQLAFLDGGELDFGTEIRDFSLIRDNDAGAFMETFEAVQNLGPDFEVLRFNNLCANGTTGGGTTTLCS